MDTMTLFSIKIERITSNEKDWIVNFLENEAEVLGEDADGKDVGFLWSFEQASDDDSIYLHIYADQEYGGSPFQVGEFVQAFLATHRPHDVFTMQWAEVSSAPVVDGFGGGAMVVTATHQSRIDTDQWVVKMAKTGI